MYMQLLMHTVLLCYHRGISTQCFCPVCILCQAVPQFINPYILTFLIISAVIELAKQFNTWLGCYWMYMYLQSIKPALHVLFYQTVAMLHVCKKDNHKIVISAYSKVMVNQKQCDIIVQSSLVSRFFEAVTKCVWVANLQLPLRSFSFVASVHSESLGMRVCTILNLGATIPHKPASIDTLRNCNDIVMQARIATYLYSLHAAPEIQAGSFTWFIKLILIKDSIFQFYTPLMFIHL